MQNIVNPPTVHPPVAAYAHAIKVPAAATRLVISGQLGLRPDGSLPDGVEAQAEQAWRNLIAILEDAGYAMSDVVRLRLYAVRAEDLPVLRDVRDRMLGDHRPASTMVVVSALAKPELLFEIEGEAVRLP